MQIQSLTSPSSFPTPFFHSTTTLFPPRPHCHSPSNLVFRQRMASGSGFRVVRSEKVNSLTVLDDDENGFPTLMDYAGKGGLNVGDDLVVLLYHIQYACKRIASLVASPFNSSLGKQVAGGNIGSDRDAPKPLDIVSVSFLLLFSFSLF